MSNGTVTLAAKDLMFEVAGILVELSNPSIKSFELTRWDALKLTTRRTTITFPDGGSLTLSLDTKNSTAQAETTPRADTVPGAETQS